jgi:hypothetical protein
MIRPTECHDNVKDVQAFLWRNFFLATVDSLIMHKSQNFPQNHGEMDP